MVEFPADWKLVKLLTAKLYTFVWNNSVLNPLSTELLYKNLRTACEVVSSSSSTATKSEK